MAWAKIDPDNSEDFLPEPYRLINRIVEDVLADVGGKVDELERKRKMEEYECGLPKVVASRTLHVAGHITCTHVEPDASSHMVVGTSAGETLVVNLTLMEVAAKRRLWESVRAVALTSGGSYRETREGPRPLPKLIVSGATSSRILVYNIIKAQFGDSLMPCCWIRVPSPERAVGSAPAPVECLCAQSSYGTTWVASLLVDRTIRVYACPLGQPEAETTTLGVTEPAILEEDDECDGVAVYDVDVNAEFASTMSVDVAMYKIQLPDMSLCPPRSLDLASFSVRLAAFSGVPFCSSSKAGYIFISSPESALLYAYRVPPLPPCVARSGMTVEALLQQVAQALPLGTLEAPDREIHLDPHRRWILPSAVTAVTISANGIFAAGLSGGCIALVCAGPSLGTVLAGHYAAVAALSFLQEEALVSVGVDGWFHHYCMRTSRLLFRCMCSAPPRPPPGVGVATLALPLAISLDDRGKMRIMDLVRGRKITRAICEELGVSESPFCVIGGSASFCVACTVKTSSVPESAKPACVPTSKPSSPSKTSRRSSHKGRRDEESFIEPAAFEPAPENCTSSLMLFHHESLLLELFPGLSERYRSGESVAELFRTLTPEEMKSAPERPPVSVAPSCSSRVGRSSLARSRKADSTTDTACTVVKSACGALKEAKVAKLTAENLQKIGSARGVGEATVLNPSQMQEETAPSVRTGTVAPPIESAWPMAVPDGGHASVQRYIQWMLEEREPRQARIHKRLQAIRKELEGE